MRFLLLSALAVAAASTGPDLWAADAEPLAPGRRVRLATVPPPSPVNHPDRAIGTVIGSAWEAVAFRGPDGQLMTLARKDKRLEGRLLASDDQALSLELAGVKEPVRVLRASITGLEISRGRNTGKGMAIGFGAGFVLGFALFGLPCNDSRFFCGSKSGLQGGKLLGLIGAGVGALAAPEHWDVVKTNRVAVGLGASSRHGPGLNASIRF